jgi:hypothetical protein
MHKSAVKLPQLVNYRDETNQFLDELHIPSPEILTIRTSTTAFRTIFSLSTCQAASPNQSHDLNVENTAYPTLACCVSKHEYCRGGQITHDASECNVQV